MANEPNYSSNPSKDEPKKEKVRVIPLEYMGIGGADIKLSTAAALLLGFYKGVIGFMLGLLIAVVAQLIITHRKKEQRSPPYYGLRDYGVDGQIGTEESPQAYICRLVAVFREVRRVLTDDGTLWLNIADSYAGSGKGIWKGATKKTDCKNNYRADTTAAIHRMPVVWDGIKAKDMIGIPWMLAFALRADGWYLRSDIIWNKTNGLPENVKDRPTKSYEHIFLLTKSPRYYYDAEAIAEPLQPCSIARYERGRSDHTKYKGFNGNQSINEKRERGQECKKLTRNRRDVWNLSTNSYRMDGHFAMFPERLVEPCILAGCPVGGVV